MSAELVYDETRPDEPWCVRFDGRLDREAHFITRNAAMRAATNAGWSPPAPGWSSIVSTGHWRKSLRAKHWAQAWPIELGWAWAIYKADPVTMCPVEVDSGIDISLAAVRDNVQHWSDNWHAHAVVVRLHPGTSHNELRRYWYATCRRHPDHRPVMAALELSTLHDSAALHFHRDCEAAWQRGER